MNQLRFNPWRTFKIVKILKTIPNKTAEKKVKAGPERQIRTYSLLVPGSETKYGYLFDQPYPNKSIKRAPMGSKKSNNG